MASTLLPAQLWNLACVETHLFLHTKTLNWFQLVWCFQMVLWWCRQADDLAVLICKKKTVLKLKNMSSYLFMLNMHLYNEFPKFWKKVCWLLPLFQPSVHLNISRKSLRPWWRKQLIGKTTLLWSTRENSTRTPGFCLGRKPRKVAFHLSLSFRTCKHVFLSGFQKKWRCCHYVARHSVHSHFSLLNNFGTHWSASKSDREVGIWKIQTSHVVLENSSQVENLLNALSEDQWWCMNSDKDQRIWNKCVMNGITGGGEKKARQIKIFLVIVYNFF